MKALKNQRVINQMMNQSSNSNVVRIIDKETGESRVWKVLNDDYPDNYKIAGLKNEYSLLKEIDSHGVIKVYAIERYGKSMAMVMEDIGGADLSEVLLNERSNTKPALTGELLEIALSLTRALADIHHASIIHKQINPGNIILNRAAKALRIIDFSSAVRFAWLKTESHDLTVDPTVLPYISPEQTGRMNRELDYRTDFYSLGMTLYELFTGRLPFSADNLGDWVFSHIAKKPPPPSTLNPDVPDQLSAIILKLINKDPEERYQSAQGIVKDLECCRDQWLAAGKIDAFLLGQKDVFTLFRIPGRLFGRQKEIARTLGVFENVTRGEKSLMLVSGFAGVGKSALINEVQSSILKSQSYFISGKFDQFNSNIPYNAFFQAFDELCQRILTLSNKQLGSWRKKLISALSPNTGLMVELVAKLKIILGKQPRVPELNPKESMQRFLVTVINFVKVFAIKEKPLVIFLDDLQWADTPSLTLMAKLIESRELEYLFIVGAYRDNEVDAAHPLSIILNELKNRHRVHELQLSSLDQAAVNRIISCSVQVPEAETSALGELIFQRTRGNPFFISELLKNFVDQGYIYLEREQGRWSWDIEKIRVAEIGGSAANFVLEQLKKLGENTRKVLQIAACIGNRFSLKLLAMTSEQSPREVARALSGAIEHGFVSPLHSDYYLAELQEGNDDFGFRYLFLHDRIQQAAYRLIPLARRKQCHLKIGRLMLENFLPEELENDLILVVRQLNAGREYVTEHKDRVDLAGLNLKAGLKAKGSSAYHPAFDCFGAAVELLNDDLWSQEHELCFSVTKEYAQCAYLCGELETAEQHFPVLIERARTNLEKAEVYYIQANKQLTTGHPDEAIHSAIQGLAVLGIKISVRQTKIDVYKELLVSKYLLGGRRIADLIYQPMLKDSRLKWIMRLITSMTPAAYVLGNIRLFTVTLVKGVNLCLRHGNSSESIFCYAGYGLVLSMMEKFAPGHEFGRLAVALGQKLQDTKFKTSVYYIYAYYIQHWNEHLQSSVSSFNTAIESGYQSGDLYFMCVALRNSISADTKLDCARAAEETRKRIDFFDEVNNLTVIHSAQANLLYYLNLQGRTKGRFSLDTDDISEMECLKNIEKNKFFTGVSNFHLRKAQLLFMYYDHEGAFHQIRKVDTMADTILGSIYMCDYKLFLFVIFSAIYPVLENGRKKQILRRLKKEYAVMKRWAAHCPVNFTHHKKIMEAELARINQDISKAIPLYDEAISTAAANDYLCYEALFNDLAAKFHFQHNNHYTAAAYVREARFLYNQWGAVAKVKHLNEFYGLSDD